MKRYKCTVAYEGKNYAGWQSQKLGNSIQEQIEAALFRIVRKPVSIVGSGRTDAGVNAWGQVFHFDGDLNLSAYQWKGAINTFLPGDIRIRHVEEVSQMFHARFCARSKCYSYRINLGEYDVFTRNTAYQCPYPLDIESMEKASTYLIGTHDFGAFNSNSYIETPDQVRTIDSIDFKLEQKTLTISYTGRGFLRYMVRMMTAALIEVGRGKMKPSDIEKKLLSKCKDTARKNAVPEGLTLMWVDHFEICAETDVMIVREFLPEDQLEFDWSLKRIEEAVKEESCNRVYALADRHSQVLYGWYCLYEEDGLKSELVYREGTDFNQLEMLRNQLIQYANCECTCIEMSQAQNRFSK